MSMQATAKQVLFEPDCTMVRSQEIQSRMLEALGPSDASPVHFDLSAVEDADVTLVQLLVAARQTAEAQGRTLSLTFSPAVAHLLARAGLASWPAAA